MTHAIQIYETGGPEVMKWEEVEVGEPGEGQVKLRQTAVGLNFIDVYFRTGAYPQKNLPFTPGMEGAGEVIAVGNGVTHVKPGDRVAYAMAVGSYAEERIAPAERMVMLPDAIDDRTGAAMMLKGMTAAYLLLRTYKVGPGTTLLFHAAAGGVDEIRAAQGLYKPDQSEANPTGTADREAKFQMLHGLAVVGGYAGIGAKDPNARD